VLHVYKDYPPVIGGIENHLRLLAEHQVRLGLDVTALVTSRDGRTTDTLENGVRVIRAARLLELLSTPLSVELFRRLRGQEPDVTHLQFPYPLGDLAQLWLGRSRATVVTYQSDIVRQRISGFIYRPFVRRLLGRADRIITTSPQYAKGSRLLGPMSAKCAVVPLGIEPADWRSVDLRCRAELERRFPGPRVLFVGRLRYYKGLDYLIRAMERVEAHLLVVGGGALRPALERQARESPAAGRIHFLGDVPQSELSAHYTAADVLALPSSHRSEAFGLVLLEAMACGTPVISTELSTGTSYANRHGETGWVVPPRDAAALAEALAACLADPERRRALGARARERVLREFGAELMVERVLEVYEQALGRSAATSESAA
jgi:rhamnosyl/mannosyltransferase